MAIGRDGRVGEKGECVAGDWQFGRLAPCGIATFGSHDTGIAWIGGIS